ncbi:EcsC family protein [Siminovitchia acidinfaciens]|uniref:EcsC family protein n=1 Tax=Siminovitchia acidinfaciens TaxID=2321395 RepID=A0A429XTW2_9BACI|nr:EcsC family protein [Siminovitchia acidinfaciens]RST71285.1 EcsC family protein [Siminovitchia acidinfaciens]
MNEYETEVMEEVQKWTRKINKRSSLINRISKQAQTKVNGLIPEKFHEVMTESIKNMVKATLVGSDFLIKNYKSEMTLFERDELVKRKLDAYRKTAVIEGAGTGAGGILLGLADFPLLLSIEMKFLFEAAAIYGYDTKKYSERLFILHVFLLAFSSDDTRKKTFNTIENWEEEKDQLTDMDWREFQQEYRDYIDFIKMFQLIPGFGAIVGAYANYNLLDHLGETAMNAYWFRIFQEKLNKKIT